MSLEFFSLFVVRMAFMGLLVLAVLPRLQARAQHLLKQGLFGITYSQQIQRAVVKTTLQGVSTGLAHLSSISTNMPQLRVSSSVYRQLVQAAPVDLSTVPSMHSSRQD